MSSSDRLDLVILGASGSIGRQTLDVVAGRSDRIRVVGLGVNSRVEGLADGLSRWPDLRSIAVADEGAAEWTRPRAAARGISVRGGNGAAARLIAELRPHAVMNAIVGAAGLDSTLAALDAGATVALANKESLVIAGDLVTTRAASTGTKIIPVDSEHGSIYRCLRDTDERDGVRSITLTASGGAFRTRTLEEIDSLPPRAALDHPTWSMGPRITVDSATLMNKGFEVIEAHWLFDVGADDIDVVIHPQSVVHGLVTLGDGSVLAHMSPPDMRTPIAYALEAAWRERFPDSEPVTVEPVTRLDLAELGALTFEAPDTTRFPCLALAYGALRTGGTATTVLNAADEVAVAGYLDGELPFSRIPAVIEETLTAHRPRPADSLDVVLETDRWAREEAARRVHAPPVASRPAGGGTPS